MHRTHIAIQEIAHQLSSVCDLNVLSFENERTDLHASKLVSNRKRQLFSQRNGIVDDNLDIDVKI